MNYIEQIKIFRKGKDEFMGKNPQSPIPLEERTTFTKLNYFPTDENYRFELELKIHPDPEKFKSLDSAGNKRLFYRFGEFKFSFEGHDLSLHAYKSNLKESGLFLPFKDTTNGKETYGAGKYLDLNENQNKLPSGKWVLDFNISYNPFCAYNHNYACALTPSENHLNIPIMAGEKKYHKD